MFLLALTTSARSPMPCALQCSGQSSVLLCHLSSAITGVLSLLETLSAFDSPDAILKMTPQLTGHSLLFVIAPPHLPKCDSPKHGPQTPSLLCLCSLSHDFIWFCGFKQRWHPDDPYTWISRLGLPPEPPFLIPAAYICPLQCLVDMSECTCPNPSLHFSLIF